ncbi:hypothetical protein K7H91_11755 [Martelella mediterranea]|uniref:hypothetical protein n=1 Tax=Martelella mediterranea TaxID=293089 RepID=UPI001E59844A|nr:hypothetical protein [Martelella mediterranea]MCD1634446.1 hypothetical protein [Martelella mediterranea]
MSVFIANFGKANYAWKACLEQSTIATINDADVHHFWLSGDRESYIDVCTRLKKTAHGDPAPKQLASRWFNLMTIIANSSGDIWVHRDGNTIWWTVSTDEPAWFDEEPRSVPYQPLKVFECHKPCKPWSSTDMNGKPLTWDAVHPKAKDFLTTESTLQELSPDNAAYVETMIRGSTLDAWHTLPLWRGKLQEAKFQPVRNFTPVQKSIADMAMQAEQTTKTANGQTVERIAKNKDFGFKDRQELECYLYDLLEAQANQCAITGLPLQFIGSHDDQQMLCSLDRIDSKGHYERDNLQIVCRFVNFWKNNMEDAEFRRLLCVVRQQ